MIFATATPIGRSAIGIIRFSGDGCFEVIKQICTATNYPIRKAIYTNIKDKHIIVDQIILLLFQNPHSYTGEDSGEIHAHGNPLILQKICSLLLKHGLALAQPGEFTKKAFLNNKLTLNEAEAVKDIIEAQNEFSLQNAMRLQKGEFRNQLMKIRAQLLNIVADLTAEIDFSDEDISFLKIAEKIQQIQHINHSIQNTIDTSKKLQIYKNGIECLILGQPNVGKSSFLNFMAGKEKAIVTSIPGTTRDFNEVQCYINNIDVLFIDTAGIHQDTNEVVEKIGIQRTLDKIQTANMMIYIFDGSQPKNMQINNFSELVTQKSLDKNKMLFLVNKKDALHHSWKEPSTTDNSKTSESTFPSLLFISVLKNENLRDLQKKLEQKIAQLLPSSSGLLLAEWQLHILHKMYHECNQTVNLLKNKEYLDIIVFSLEAVLQHIAELTGKISNETILGRIFSRFCIGK